MISTRIVADNPRWHSFEQRAEAGKGIRSSEESIKGWRALDLPVEHNKGGVVMKLWGALMGLMAALVAAAAFMVPAALADPPGGTTTFCHRTGSETNPYVVITTSTVAWLVAHQPGANHPTLNGRDDIGPLDEEEGDDCIPKK